MIYFKLRMANPFFRPQPDFENTDYYWKDVNLTKHKNFEIQISRFEPDHVFDVAVDLCWWGRDHAGPELDINLWGFMFNMKVYDSRHWNHDEH
jgi:hypothetical protein